jgi:hypothetical protein
MKCNTLLLLVATLASTGASAAERAVAVAPMLQMSWEFVTPGTGARLRPHLGVGFWQRASGAKPGVGANYVSALEYQLPEAAPARVRSASFQFSGRPSRCVGAEPVVIEVYAYAGDGRADVDDAHAGSRVAQLSASCSDNRRSRGRSTSRRSFASCRSTRVFAMSASTSARPTTGRDRGSST